MFTGEKLKTYTTALKFVREFLLMKHGGWILYVVQLIVGFLYTNNEMEKAEKKGYNSGNTVANEERKTLVNTVNNQKSEIFDLNLKNVNLQKTIDTCQNKIYKSKQDEIDELYKQAVEARKEARKLNQTIKMN